MKLILTADVANLGGPGDLVEVKDGYGHNFLLPRGMAIMATRGAQKQVETIRRTQQARQIRDLDHARQVATALSGITPVTLTARAAPAGGRLFGSVTAAEVAAAVQAAGGPTLDKRAIDLTAAIKSTGSHEVTVRLHPEVTVSLALEVVSG